MKAFSPIIKSKISIAIHVDRFQIPISLSSAKKLRLVTRAVSGLSRERRQESDKS